MIFYFFLQVKIAVKFVDGWPVIGRIRFCFAHPPYIQMTASPLYKGGIDVTYFPGADRWLVIYNY
jgi:Ca2+-dependent lipid-binding protein